MSDFVIAMAPIVFFWSVPLLPIFYVVFVGTVERVVEVGRGR